MNNVLQFPRITDRFTTLTLQDLDGREIASAAFPCGQVTRVWMWIEDQVRASAGPCDVTMVDDDVVLADGLPVARVVF